MTKHKHFDKICIAAMILSVVFVFALLQDEHLGIQSSIQNPPYSEKLFNDNYVHEINLVVENWEDFVKNAEKEEYIPCDIEIDGETFPNVALRVKGNNSKSLTAKYGLSRYSLKIEFDHYTSGYSYYGLDKLSLDASFQDNSYMKSFIAFDMFEHMDVPTPLSSYAFVTVNDVDWGLFLAIEEPENAFLKRNYGKSHGKLYKPDYKSLSDDNDDLALKYIDDEADSYPNIFDNAKTKISGADKARIIEALRVLDSKSNLSSAINIDEVVRYFTVQIFVMNWDSYIGQTGHNYLLYEENGIISMLPWDYNLAFGTYALGKTNPVKDPTVLINYPINTPAEGKVMLNRPLYHHLMGQQEILELYHSHFDKLIATYFKNRLFETKIAETKMMIAPYVKKDPTAFCSYQDFELAVDTLMDTCSLRAESIDLQLRGKLPITLKEQGMHPEAKLDASHINLRNLGDFNDLENSLDKQNEALKKIPSL